MLKVVNFFNCIICKRLLLGFSFFSIIGVFLEIMMQFFWGEGG